MKLKEIAFMRSLIQASYRRRMWWFFFNLILLASAVSVIRFVLVPKVVEFPDTFHVVLGVIALLVAVVELFLFSLYYLGGDNFPWQRRKRELRALNGNIKDDFENLAHMVPLHRYFETL